jgi:3-deoxy-manno-octulosonate cytidylyltransferase (CMP-KDO synthetase)
MVGIIVIPARYGSKRFPGKPLEILGDLPILVHVYRVAKHAADRYATPVEVIVATDSSLIAQVAEREKIPYVMTPESCKTGSDRVATAIAGKEYDFVINFQGDAPLTPPYLLSQMMEVLSNPTVEVVTPVTQLSWRALDTLREHKKASPFSGTTVILNTDLTAAWFSKNIIPAIRKEDRSQPLSPVFKHIGIYGYRQKLLKRFISLPTGHYEQIEELEQLRFLENNIPIQCFKVDFKEYPQHGGIDTPADLAAAQELIRTFGPPERWS